MVLYDETLLNRPLARRLNIAGTSGRTGREGKMNLGTLGCFRFFASQEVSPFDPPRLHDSMQMCTSGDGLQRGPLRKHVHFVSISNVPTHVIKVPIHLINLDHNMSRTKDIQGTIHTRKLRASSSLVNSSESTFFRIRAGRCSVRYMQGAGSTSGDCARADQPGR
jgi:hypothetical protein